MTANEQAMALLYQAMAEPIGLILRTSDTERARQRLYQARAKSGDPDLAILQFRISPIPAEGDLIITKAAIKVKRDREVDDLK